MIGIRAHLARAEERSHADLLLEVGGVVNRSGDNRKRSASALRSLRRDETGAMETFGSGPRRSLLYHPRLNTHPQTECWDGQLRPRHLAHFPQSGPFPFERAVQRRRQSNDSHTNSAIRIAVVSEVMPYRVGSMNTPGSSDCAHVRRLGVALTARVIGEARLAFGGLR